MIDKNATISSSMNYIRTADAVLRYVAGEHLLVPIRSGQTLDAENLYILDDVGACIWNVLEAVCSFQKLVDCIETHFEVSEGQDVEKDLQELLVDLISQGLVRTEAVN